ncbi:extracellular solute-binding protein [Candidatus Dojkabacteria bacterium]|uniref:Extracellular solute-binding protein n=1 Tax=Candidatus Dojkabacteria bacterium TaxID=2099670 RepID=A0A955I879_9BACT|nr:extracellular solute-binding protein [Candidatus Dojkabacteria bacterium]
MNNHKFAKIFLLLVVSLLFLTGCKKDDTSTQNGDGNNDQVTLIWWNMFDSEENVKPLIDAFTSQNPNVVIQYRQQGITGGVTSYRNLLDNALTDAESINDPDIFTLENTWVGKYQEYISPAPSNIIGSDYYNDFYPIVKEDFGKVNSLGVPLYVDALAVIYNKDKLIEGGYTIPDNDWSEFKNQAKSLTQRDTNNKIVSAGFAAASAENVQFNFDILSLLILQNGADLNSPSVLSTFATNSDVEGAFNFYEEFSASTGSWNDEQKLDVAAFLEGKLAMFIAPSWRLNDILIYNEKYNLGLDIGIASVPQLSGTDNISWGTYWGQTVSKESPNTDVAWEFVKFIAEADQLRALDQKVKENGRMVGVFYPRLSMSSEISDDPYLRVYTQAMPFAKSWDMKDGYIIESEFNNYFKDRGSDLNQIQSAINSTIN